MNGRLLNVALAKTIVALCVAATGVSTRAFARDVAFRRSTLFRNVLSKTQFGNSAVVDINSCRTTRVRAVLSAVSKRSASMR